MRAVSLFILAGFLPNMCWAYVPADKNTQQYRWALAAVGDTIQTYFSDYTFVGDATLSLGYLVKFGDAIKERPQQSPSELVELCMNKTIRMLQTGIVCNKPEGCVRDDKTYKKGQIVISAKNECVAFVDDLIKNNNSRYAVNVRTATRPGTYIDKTSKCGGRAYRVVNVITGKDSDNKIYVNEGNGKYVLSKYTTQYNGTFINEPAEGQGVSAGHTRGVYNNSYIFFTDVTSKIYELYNSGRGTPWYSAGAFLHLMPNMAYDFKSSWTEKTCDPANFGFRVTDQNSSAAHTNGVVFKGQVVTLEDLGHIITGMHQEDSIAPDKVVEASVSKLQGVSGKTLGGAAIGALGGATVPGGAVVGVAVGAWKGTPSAQESQYANAIRGEAYAKMKDEKDDVTFASARTANEQRAYSLARRHMAKKHGLNAADIQCSGVCKDSFDDYVTCYYNKGQSSKVVVYKFDSICNGSDKDIPKF